MNHRYFFSGADIMRFVAIESIEDTLYVLNRSFLFKGKSAGIHTQFQKVELKQPANYYIKISLFETLWHIHSGEVLVYPASYLSMR